MLTFCLWEQWVGHSSRMRFLIKCVVSTEGAVSFDLTPNGDWRRGMWEKGKPSITQDAHLVQNKDTPFCMKAGAAEVRSP